MIKVATAYERFWNDIRDPALFVVLLYLELKCM
jgi:hypothetical protein